MANTPEKKQEKWKETQETHIKLGKKLEKRKSKLSLISPIGGAGAVKF